MSPFHSVDEPPAGAASQTAATPSLSEIFEQHTSFLWRALINLGVPAAEAPDQCQEIMITVQRRLASFDGVSLRGWLAYRHRHPRNPTAFPAAHHPRLPGPRRSLDQPADSITESGNEPV
jgi:hypothetical protein